MSIKALEHNWALIHPLLMFLLWVFMRVTRDRNFARILGRMGSEWNVDSRHELALAAAAAIYETNGKISTLKYISAVMRTVILCSVATDVLHLLYEMQYDDGTNHMGQALDTFAIDSMAALVFGVGGALLFNIVFYWFTRPRLLNRPYTGIRYYSLLSCK